MILVFYVNQASRMTMVSLNDSKFDETLFMEEQLKQYDPDSKLIDQLILEQEKLLDAIHVNHPHIVKKQRVYQFK
jgi:cytochrome c biogenesis protein ResB